MNPDFDLSFPAVVTVLSKVCWSRLISHRNFPWLLLESPLPPSLAVTGNPPPLSPRRHGFVSCCSCWRSAGHATGISFLPRHRHRHILPVFVYNAQSNPLETEQELVSTTKLSANAPQDTEIMLYPTKHRSSSYVVDFCF